MIQTTTPQTLCHIEQAGQTAYWIYDNLLTVLLRLERDEKRDIDKLMDKVKTMHTDLGEILNSLNFKN